jgi:hypothetical protein
MAACLKCGFDLADDQSECPCCGVIVAKARPARPRPAAPEVKADTAPAPAPFPAPSAAKAPSPAPPFAAFAAPVWQPRGDATKLRLFAAAIDNLIATILCIVTEIFEANPLLLGLLPGALAVVWSKHRQRFGDMLAETIVVRRAVAAAMQRA